MRFSGWQKWTVCRLIFSTLQKAGVDRLGVGYYSLRRSFETIAAQTGQQVAVNCVMGHEEAGMSAVYRQFVSDENIRMVCEHVRNWVFPILLFLLFCLIRLGGVSVLCFPWDCKLNSVEAAAH